MVNSYDVIICDIIIDFFLKVNDIINPYFAVLGSIIPSLQAKLSVQLENTKLRFKEFLSTSRKKYMNLGPRSLCLGNDSLLV